MSLRATIGSRNDRERHFCQLHLSYDDDEGCNEEYGADSPSTEHERLGTLLQIGEALSSTLNAKAGIQEVLETLARRHAIARSLVVLMDEEGRQLHVEAAHGLNRPSHHIHYAAGEGVIGKVVESGRAVIVPRVTKEPTLVFRAAVARMTRTKKSPASSACPSASIAASLAPWA